MQLKICNYTQLLSTLTVEIDVAEGMKISENINIMVFHKLHNNQANSSISDLVLQSQRCILGNWKFTDNKIFVVFEISEWVCVSIVLLCYFM